MFAHLRGDTEIIFLSHEPRNNILKDLGWTQASLSLKYYLTWYEGGNTKITGSEIKYREKTTHKCKILSFSVGNERQFPNILSLKSHYVVLNRPDYVYLDDQ